MCQTQLAHLHKFRSLAGKQREWTRSIITEGRLYFSSALDFNDPFDCLPRLSFEANEDELVEHFRRHLRPRGTPPSDAEIVRRAKEIAQGNAPTQSTLEDMFRRSKERLGILSLSERCDHVLLWSHYADAHRGICLRFVSTDGSPFFGEAQKVKYSAQRPTLNIFRQSMDEQIDNALMTKADFWSYECEWRIFDHRRGPGVHPFPHHLLDGIILGAQMSQQDIDEVIGWRNAAPHPIGLYRAIIDSGMFRLNVVPFQ